MKIIITSLLLMFVSNVLGQSTEIYVSDAGHRWLTALGTFDANRSVLNISSTSGGLFDSATGVTRVDDGTITLTFDSCHSGIAEYDIPSIDRKGSIPIRRVAADNIALCEVLKDE